MTTTTLETLRAEPRARWSERMRAHVVLVRPFTLLVPVLGVVSGAVTAMGSAANRTTAVTATVVLTVVLGASCAALLNAASNVLNQIHDLDIDRVNKPNRPLPAGLVSVNAARNLSVVLYALAIVPTWFVVPDRHECTLLFLLGATATLVYSTPALGRTKGRGFWANVTIAVPRGCLLKVAGWSMVASIWHVEPWFIGVIFFLFLVGAASTKDFSDMPGDGLGGCRTLPIQYGAKRAAAIIAPFFVLPWLLLPVGAHTTNPWNQRHMLLTGDPTVLTALGICLSSWGLYAAWLMLRRPEELARSENHPSWTHMYLMMIAAQVGVGAAYLL